MTGTPRTGSNVFPRNIIPVHVDAKAHTRSVTPVSFTQLFRYSTRFELFLNGIGVVGAVISGVSHGLISLIFGFLTQEFITFGSAEIAYWLNEDKQTALQEFETAAAHFRRVSAQDSLYLVCLGIAALLGAYSYMVTWVYTGEVNAKRIREKYLQAVLRQEVAYFDKVSAGEITTRIQTDTHLIQQGISEKVALCVHLIVAFITSFVLAFSRSWRLAFALSSIFPCVGIAGAVMITFISKYMQFSLKHVAKGGCLAEELISTIRTVHAFGTHKILGELYDIHVAQAQVTDVKAALVHGACFGVIFFVMYASHALAFQFGTTLVNEGQVNPGEVVNVFLAIVIGGIALVLLAPEMQAVLRARGAAAKLFATIERKSDIDSSDPGGLRPKRVVGEITMEDLKFNYPSRPEVPIIKGIDITLAAGQNVALVGASGSGKSTIISLIERFYDPLSGSVKLDGVDIRDLNVKWLRSQIGLVSQEPTLFATTIRGNVEHGLINTPYEHVSDEEKFKLVKEACIKANADGFISKLPNGYNTMVGERGFRLSGGQKQRIAIARAIVSNPRILLLDEATSALDTQSEGIVQDALDKASVGRTTITIAHRLSTIKDADCIYVMGDGLILEKGAHMELLADENGAYSRLVRAQRLRETKVIDDNDGNSTAAVSADTDMEKGCNKDEIGLDCYPLIGDNGEMYGNKYTLPYICMRLGSLYREGLWRYAVGSLFAIMSGMVYPCISIVFGQAVAGLDQPDPAIRKYEGNRNALWFFVIAVLSAVSMNCQIYFFASAAGNVISKLRSLSFKAILRQDVEYFDKDENSAGTLTDGLSRNPQKMNGLAGVTSASIVQAFANLIGGSIIALIYAWKPGLVGTACIPFLVWPGYTRLHLVVLKDQQNKGAHEKSAQIACEAAGAIRTVAALTREEDCLRLYGSLLEEPLRESNRTSMWSSLLYAMSHATPLFVIALVFWYGSILGSHLEIGAKSFFVVLMSTTCGAIQAGGVFSFAPDISLAASAGASIFKLIDSVPKIEIEFTEGQTLENKTVRGEIWFQNVHFRYPTRPEVRVLQNLSLKIEPGTYVALVGPSGCGKSTIIQMIERFYDPLAGRVLLDDEPIGEYNIREYRKHIALVSQEPTLYTGTIRFNILLGATKPESEVTQKEIETACRDANILDFIQSLPDGFDTQVGSKGSQLSGGQKQRIAIARALLRDPKVLLLDEATSALDSNSEKIVQDALDRAAKGRTTIAIAHRLSTIQNADCIYFIKDGRVSESGTHDELLSLHGDYYEHIQLQALSKKS